MTEAINRASEMLKIAAFVIRENAPDALHDYDDTTCDGYCIADDCESAAEAITAIRDLEAERNGALTALVESREAQQEADRAIANLQREYDKRGDRISELEAVRDAALSATIPAVAPGVRVLEWRDSSVPANAVCHAVAAFGTYFIDACLEGYFSVTYDDNGVARCKGLEAAKAAAQADYEARIITALDTPAPALMDELVEALRANLVFAEKVAEAADIDPEETSLNVRVMPEGREVATRTWAEVIAQGHAVLAKLDAKP